MGVGMSAVGWVWGGSPPTREKELYDLREQEGELSHWCFRVPLPQSSWPAGLLVPTRLRGPACSGWVTLC